MKKTKKSTRRFCAFLVCASMLVGLLPAWSPTNVRNVMAAGSGGAQAVEILPGHEAWHGDIDWLLQDYTRNSNPFDFSDDERLLYEQLVKAADDVMYGEYTDFEGEVCVPYFSVPGITRESAEKVARVFISQNPLYFWIQYYRLGRTADGYSVSFFIKNEYKKYSDLMAKWAELKVEIEKYLKKAETAPDDYTKALCLYKEITSNNIYWYDDNGEPSDDPRAGSIEGIFLEHKAVCEGFSKAYMLLLSLAGVNSIRMTGWAQNGMGHAWNCVEIDGAPYLCDSTWDVEQTDPTKYNWFMIGYEKDADRHILEKAAVPADIPEKYDYAEIDLPYKGKYVYTHSNCSNQAKEEPIVTMSLIYPVDADVHVYVYNGTIPVDISEGKIRVVEGTEITIEGVQGEKAATVHETWPNAQTYLPGDVIAARDGAYLSVTFANDVVLSHSEPYDIWLSDDGTTGTAYVDLYLGSQKTIEKHPITLTRNAAAANAFLASADFKGYISDSVWCDRADFDYGMLPIDTLYDTGITGLSSDITVPASEQAFQITTKQRGYNAHIVYLNADGYEVRIYDTQGNLIPSSGEAPLGEPLRIGLYDGKSEVPATFYCCTGDETVPHEIDKSAFTPAGLSHLTWVAGTVDNTLSSVTPISDPITVENGLAKEQVIALKLPAVTDITTEDGRTMQARIDWNGFGTYDSHEKAAHDVTVSGTVILPDGIVNTNGISTDITATLSVTAATEISFSEMLNKDKIPSCITVANGTPMTPSEVGLTPVYAFEHRTTIVNGGSTSSYTNYLLLKLKWEYDAANHKMIGTLDSDGYFSSDSIEVDIIEESAGGITVPVNMAGVSKYGLTFMNGNNETVDGFYACQSNSYKSLLNFTFPEGDQTNREITVTVPRGFSNVSAYHTENIEHVHQADVTKNDDGTWTVKIGVDDDYDITKTLNIELSMKSVYTRKEYTEYGSRYGSRLNDCANDLGIMYPVGDEVPFKIAYTATENGETGTVNLPLDDRLQMKYSENFVSFKQATAGTLRQTPGQKATVNFANAYEFYNTSPYVTDVITVYPLPDIVSAPTDYTKAYNSGNAYASNPSYVTQGRLSSCTATFANGMPSGTYMADETSYVVCRDVFGEVYVVRADATNDKYKSSFTIQMADEMIESAQAENPLPEWLANTEDDYYIGRVYPKGGSTTQLADTQQVVEAKLYTDDSAKNNYNKYIYGPVTIKIEIPDGAMPAFIRTDGQVRLSNLSDITCTLLYWDGTKETVPKSELQFVNEYITLMETDTALGRGEKRVKEVVIDCMSYPYTNVGYSLLNVGLEAYGTYHDGTPVPLGSYIRYENGHIKTDCPRVEGTITFENVSELFELSYDAYLIGYGVVGVNDARFLQKDNVYRYNYRLNKPAVEATLELGRSSLGDEHIKNIKLVCNVADPELFHITGLYDFKLECDHIKFYFTDGSSQTYNLNNNWFSEYQGAQNIDDGSGRVVSRVEFIWDDSSCMDNGNDLRYFSAVSLNSYINFDRYLELYGKTNQNVKMMTGSVFVDGNKVLDMDDYYVDIRTILEDTAYFGVYTLNAYYTPPVSYSNGTNISIVSKLEQTDYAYAEWHMDSRWYVQSAPYVGPHYIDSYTVVVSANNGGEIDPNHDVYMKLSEYRFDADEDGVKELVLQESGRLLASKVKKLSQGRYEITFKDFYANGYERVCVPFRGSMNTTKNISASMWATDVKMPEDQAYVLPPSYEKYMEVKHKAQAKTGYQAATIVVLTAYTEMVECYGKSVCNQNPYDEIYKIADDEEFTYATHVFNSINAQMNDAEFIIELPKKGQVVTVKEETYTQEFTAVLKGITVPADVDKNYKMYYTVNGSIWTPFTAMSEIADRTAVQAIKVTADKAVNGDEIVLTLDSVADVNSVSKFTTKFTYTDSNSNMQKSDYTRIIPYVITVKRELKVPTDEIDFGEFKEGEPFVKAIEQIELDSVGCREVSNVTLALVSVQSEDVPDAFEKDGEFVAGSADTLVPIAADESLFVDVNIARAYPEGSYRAIARVDWEDDLGTHTKDIPVHFTVIGKRTLTYHPNADNDTVLGIPSQLSTFDRAVAVSENIPQRTGYIFKGWSYTSAGTGSILSGGANVD